MRNTALILLLAACAAAATAQTAAKPATAPAKSATAKPAAKPATTSAKAAGPADKLPAGVTALTAEKKTLYAVSLRYQDEVIGDGAKVETGKVAKCAFTLWTAGPDGVRVDSSDDHRSPALDKDHKPVMDADGKPKMGDAQPAQFIVGQGRPFPGWDQGVNGMQVHGKRRIFVPWQLGLGDREIPKRDDKHPAVPAKSDLILDVELTEVSDAPPQPHPGMMPPNHAPMGGIPHPMPGAPGTPGAPAAAPAATTPAAPAPTPAPAATPATPAQPQSK